MQSKTTIILGIVAVVIIGGIVGAGIYLQQPAPAQNPQPVKQDKKLPSATELAEKLPDEQPAITLALTETYPTLLTSYTINTGKLYHDGSWYGTTLTYYGTDENNRDTLRVLMRKKNDKWEVLSKPPRIILRAADYPDAPKSVVQDINRPAPLPGTATSPAIN